MMESFSGYQFKDLKDRYEKKKTIRISANDIENIFKNHKSFIQCLLKFIKILI